MRGRPMGSWINSQYRWAAMDDWVPGGITGMDPCEASAQLVRRWLHAFGPGTTADVQWWTGWTVRDTRRALDDVGAVVVTMETADGDIDAWLAPDDLDAVRGSSKWVALLPGLDPTTMGWKDRRWYLDARIGSQVVDRNGNAGPTIWVDGRIVGSWVQRKDGTDRARLAHRRAAGSPCSGRGERAPAGDRVGRHPLHHSVPRSDSGRAALGLTALELWPTLPRSAALSRWGILTRSRRLQELSRPRECHDGGILI